MQLMSTHHDKYDKKWSYWRFSTWQADAREWCVVANVEHVAIVNTAYAYYPRNLSRPDQLDGIMHKLHRPGHTKDSMSFAEQGVTPFDGKVVFGPVDPLDTTVQDDFVRVVSEDLCRDWNESWNKRRAAAGQVGELIRYTCVKDPVAPHTVAIHKLGVSERMRGQLIRGFTS